MELNAGRAIVNKEYITPLIPVTMVNVMKKTPASFDPWEPNTTSVPI
jgi:hypothetical protein